MALKRASRNDSDGQHTFLLQSWSDQSFHQAISGWIWMYFHDSVTTPVPMTPAAQLPSCPGKVNISPSLLIRWNLQVWALRSETKRHLRNIEIFPPVMYLVMSTILMTALRIFWSRIQNNPETKNHNQEEPVPINFFFAILVDSCSGWSFHSSTQHTTLFRRQRCWSQTSCCSPPVSPKDEANVSHWLVTTGFKIKESKMRIDTTFKTWNDMIKQT